MESSQPQICDQQAGAKASDLFNAPDADVVFRSSDGTLFRVHAKQLEFASDGFPPAQFSTEGQVVDLTEDAQTLELMFRFVYPRFLPSLEFVEFSTLVSLAEAVEKYQIFTGMKLCNIYMAQALTPDNAIAVLDYSVKHGYPSLANRAAPYVTLAGLSQVSTTNTTLSPELFRRWVLYYNHWTSVMRSTTTGSFALRKDHLTPSIPGRMKPPACSAWSGYQKTILTDLANLAGTKNDSSIVQLITVPREASTCCLNEAEGWRNDLLKTISDIPPFSEV